MYGTHELDPGLQPPSWPGPLFHQEGLACQFPMLAIYVSRHSEHVLIDTNYVLMMPSFLLERQEDKLGEVFISPYLVISFLWDFTIASSTSN